MTRFLFFRRTCTYLKKLAISFILVTQMHLSKRTNHVLPSEGVSIQVEASLEHSSPMEELLENPRRALANLQRIENGIAKYKNLPKHNPNGFSREERAHLTRLLRRLRMIRKSDIKDLLVLLNSEELYL
jgi:hypothetical protein